MGFAARYPGCQGGVDAHCPLCHGGSLLLMVTSVRAVFVMHVCRNANHGTLSCPFVVRHDLPFSQRPEIAGARPNHPWSRMVATRLVRVSLRPRSIRTAPRARSLQPGARLLVPDDSSRSAVHRHSTAHPARTAAD